MTESKSFSQETFKDLSDVRKDATRLSIASVGEELEDNVLKGQENVVLENGVYTITCPFDGEQFKSTYLGTALHEEGVYRSRNFVTDKHIPHESDLEKSETLVEDWSRSDGEPVDDSEVFGLDQVDNLPEGKEFRTVYLVDSSTETSRCEKFKQEKTSSEAV